MDFKKERILSDTNLSIETINVKPDLSDRFSFFALNSGVASKKCNVKQEFLDYDEMTIEECDLSKHESSLNGSDGLHQDFAADKVEECELSKQENSFHEESQDFADRGIDSFYEANKVVPEREFANKDTNMKNEPKSNDMIKTYKCPHCNYKCKSNRILQRHFNVCYNEACEFYQCAECNYRYSRKQSLVKHIKCIHGNREFKCSRCAFRTRYKGGLVRHIQVIHVQYDTVYLCDFCNFYTCIASNLRAHKRHKHTKIADSNIRFEEEEVGGLSRHYTLKNFKNEKYYQCLHCEYKATKRCYYKRHFDRRHIKSKKSFECFDCSYVTQHRSYLVEHIKYVHAKITLDNGKFYQCYKCHRSMKHKQSLRKHMKRHNMKR